MDNEFWDQHFTQADVARLLGVSRQNIQQRVKRGSIPSSRDSGGLLGIPKDWFFTTVALRNRTKEVAYGE